MEYFNELWPYILSFCGAVIAAGGACVVAVFNYYRRKFDGDKKMNDEKELKNEKETNDEQKQR